MIHFNLIMFWYAGAQGRDGARDCLLNMTDKAVVFVRNARSQGGEGVSLAVDENLV